MLARRRARRFVLPGFTLSFGITATFVSLIVLLPLAALVAHASGLTTAGFAAAAFGERALAAYRLTFGAALAAAATNVPFGIVAAWVLVRYRFPGRRLLDAVVDLPFALPTAVAGIALTTIYAENGIVGSWLARFGIAVAYTPLGVYLALTFIGLPFVVRTLQPVLEDLEPEYEEAAATLGASRAQAFARVVLPALAPAALTGFALALGRAIGEYGSVVFISGNMPGRTEIAPLLIVTKLEQYDYAGATAIASVLLVVSFMLLLTVNVLQRRLRHARAEA